MGATTTVGAQCYGSFQLDTKVDFRFPGIELAS